jgi:RNA polymerase sigma-70 factor (ECF subfamily)
MAMMPKTSEHALIRKAKAGDGKAIEALIRAHQDALYAFMLRMSGRPDVAEDIVQESFVRVLRNLDRFDTRFRFSTWLFTIAKRLYVNAMQKHRPAYDSDVVSAHEGRDASPGHDAAHKEMIQNVRSMLDIALRKLTAQQREIVLLFHQQNWPITDIALHLHMPEGTVKSHLHRARKRMKLVIEANHILHTQAQEVWT